MKLFFCTYAKNAAMKIGMSFSAKLKFLSN